MVCSEKVRDVYEATQAPGCTNRGDAYNLTQQPPPINRRECGGTFGLPPTHKEREKMAINTLSEDSPPVSDAVRGGRYLVSAVIRQAYQDLKAMYSPKSRTPKGEKHVRKKQVPHTDIRQSAKNFLRSQDCKECVSLLGISSRNFQKVLNRL